MGESILNSFKKHTNIKLLYFFEFASLSCFQPFISIYLNSKQLKPSIIGIITCLIPFLSFLSSPFWANISDRFGIQKKIVIVNSLLSMIALLLLIPTGDNIVGIFILIGLYSIVSSPICPIVDSLVLKDLGEDSKLYGQQRLFGAISYGIVAFFTGMVINHFSMNYLYVIYAFWMVVFLIFYVFNQTKYGSKLKLTNSINSFKKLINEKTIGGTDENNDTEIDVITPGNPYDENSKGSTLKQSKSNSNIISSNDIVQSNENLIENEREDQLEQDLEMDEIGSLVFSSNNNSSQDLGEAILSSQNDNNNNNNNNNNTNEVLLKDGADFIKNEPITNGGDVEEIPIDLMYSEEKLTNKQVMKNIVKNPQMMIFLFAMVICGMTSNIISNFLFLFLKDHKNASNFLLGSTLPFTVVMELPFFFFGKQLLEKAGVTNMIIIGHSAYIIRLCLYNIFAIDSISAWFVLPIETLHGIAFATLWGAGVELSSQMAPKGYEAFYQGIFSGIYCGLGSGIGSIIGGFLYEHKSAFFLFRFTALITIVSLVVFTLSQLFYSRKQSNKSGIISQSHF
ncbi:hypothetical protein RB653_009337 [Dictyostelium firmibasis]|uniref:Major facilitator superfamily associated domain-containing protein n=1 Tax=Dictyostelium firmibasis TaxID=79012 RepID=A0AAN7YXB0_9MYCE